MVLDRWLATVRRWLDRYLQQRAVIRLAWRSFAQGHEHPER
jgi:hypothetical protein